MSRSLDLTDTEHLLYYAWTLICNARCFDDRLQEQWQAGFAEFRNAYHAHLDKLDTAR